MSHATPATPKANRGPHAWSATSSRQLITVNEAGNDDTEIVQKKSEIFFFPVRGVPSSKLLYLAVISLTFVGLW